MAGNCVQDGSSVVSKVSAILGAFAFDRRLRITDIAGWTGLPLSTVHRLVRELVAAGILRRGDDALYDMNNLFMPNASPRYLDRPSDIRAMAAPVLEDLGAVTGNDVRLGVLDRCRVAYIEKVPGCRPISTFTEASTLPAHATALGKALLAFSKPDVVDKVISQGLTRYTPATITSVRRLFHILATTRRRGLAFERGELAKDYLAVAAPIFGRMDKIVGALAVRIHEGTIEMPVVLPALTVAARTLSRDLAQLSRPRIRDHRPQPYRRSNMAAIGRENEGATVESLLDHIERRMAQPMR